VASRIHAGYEIAPAVDGGFFVTGSFRDYEMGGTAYAGTLPECLEYLRSKLSKPAAQEAQKQAA
jgi:hypothetical protein